MNSGFKAIFTGIVKFLDKYSILVAAVVIYGYYLFTSIDLIEEGKHKGFVGYIMQFDSLILLWIIAAIVIQLQRYRKHQGEEQEYRKKIQQEFERQQIHLQLLDEITKLLQDNVNNPLATISTTSHSIRRKISSDDEIAGWLDRIDASLHRIHSSINDIKAYQTQKIVEQKKEGPILVMQN